MGKRSEVYSCDNHAEIVTSPTGVQFYSSIQYNGTTYVGQFPSGRLYVFDGRALKLSDFAPDDILNKRNKYYEAQSMAEYCGDLYIGYYPKGEIYRYDHKLKSWAMFFRAFSEGPEENGIPYYGNMHLSYSPDRNIYDRFFFAQRVSSLVPFGDSLYVTTSNLGGWNVNTPNPTFLSQKSILEYGAIYKIHKEGCATKY